MGSIRLIRWCVPGLCNYLPIVLEKGGVGAHSTILLSYEEALNVIEKQNETNDYNDVTEYIRNWICFDRSFFVLQEKIQLSFESSIRQCQVPHNGRSGIKYRV